MGRRVPDCAKRLLTITIVAVLLAVLGCGGGGGASTGWVSGLRPDPLALPTGGTQDFEAWSTRVITDVDWVVREGAAGGTVAPFTVGDAFFATYTAPMAAGVYHVDATLTYSDTVGGSNTQVVSATITVQ